MSVEVVIPNITPGIGEGPHWEDNTQRLVFVDFEQKTVFRWDSLTRNIETLQLEDMVGCITPCKKGGYLVGVGRQLAHLHWSSKNLTKLHEIPLHGIQNMFNDGKCDPAGRFWIVSAGKTLSYEPLEVDVEKGELYCLDTDGSFHKHLDKLNVSNGLAWTSDHRTMYFIDSIPGQIMAFDYDVTSGNISKILRKVEIPCKRVTSCCFGGTNLDELYVTSGKEGSTDAEIRDFPAAGSVFRVTGLGVKGHPANVFQGNC